MWPIPCKTLSIRQSLKMLPMCFGTKIKWDACGSRCVGLLGDVYRLGLPRVTIT